MKLQLLSGLLLAVCAGAAAQSKPTSTYTVSTLRTPAAAASASLPNAPSPSSAGAGVTGVTHRRPPAYPVQESVTFKKKLTYYLRSTGSFRNFLEAGFLSGIPNLPSAPPQPQPPAVLTIQTGQDYANAMDTWGDGMDAWRRDSEDELRYREHRFEVGLATAETRDFLSDLVLPVVLREDPRYVPGDIYSGLGARMGHALASIVVTKTDHGSLALNIPKLAGTVGAAFLAKEEYARLLGAPELNSGQFVERYIGYSLAGDLATNMGRELVRTAVRPDIERYNDRGMVSSDNYYPLSLGGTALYWVRSTWGLRNFVQGALIAGVPSIGTEPDQPVVPTITTQQQAMQEEEILVSYGQREQGWRDNLEDNVRYHERRLIGGFGESETQEFLANLAVPLATRMDPRYIAMGPDHSAGSRLENAFTGVVIGRTDSGHRMVNLPTLVGTVGAAFIAKESFYPKLGVPELESNRVLGKTIGFNLAGDALLNLFGEFFPHRGY